jgi:hypothetical protein
MAIAPAYFIFVYRTFCGKVTTATRTVAPKLTALTELSLAGLWATIPSYIQKRGAQTPPPLHEPAHLAKYSAKRLSRPE